MKKTGFRERKKRKYNNNEMTSRKIQHCACLLGWLVICIVCTELAGDCRAKNHRYACISIYMYILNSLIYAPQQWHFNATKTHTCAAVWLRWSKFSIKLGAYKVSAIKGSKLFTSDLIVIQFENNLLNSLKLLKFIVFNFFCFVLFDYLSLFHVHSFNTSI